MNVYTMKIRFLTPVFIGSGYELDALSYMVKGEGSKNYLFFLEIQKWLQKHNNNSQIQDALSQFDYLSLRRLIAEASDSEGFSRYKIEITSSHFNSLYKEVLDGKRQEHQLIVELFPRNGTNFSPYIPASSIKGSIRTAVGNFVYPLVENKVQSLCTQKQRLKDGCYSQFNRFTFGDPKFDGFKYLKISDCVLPKDSTVIVEPQEVYMAKKSPTPKNFVEATRSQISDGMFEAKTKCIIGDFGDLMWSKRRVKRKIKSFDLRWLIKRINEFYISRYKKELEFYTQNLDYIRNIMLSLFNQIKKEISQSQSKALLRLGHFSHIECVTWDNRIPKAKKYGTTRTLANGRYPFGWVLISFEEGYHEDELKEETAKDQLPLQTEEAAQAKSEAKTEPEQELSEVEKICKELVAKKDEHYSMEIYWRLDSFPEEDRRKIAQALKQCWQAIGKWGKKVSRKQKEKIKKIKGILGE